MDSNRGKEAKSDHSDDLYKQAVALARREKNASISFLQRQLHIGFEQASRMVERMAQERVISRADAISRVLDS